MNIAFNYRYYTTPDHFETIALNFDTYVSKKVAYTLNDIGAVVRFAQDEQSNGRYVALYLTYEENFLIKKWLRTNWIIIKS